mmetsp:Transcript_30136/g.71790  ORF Transcript_30136/g.71790 Transcript_30136/m.71790 type:complete len:306 (+) Transcript_30136:396-1313(+)
MVAQPSVPSARRRTCTRITSTSGSFVGGPRTSTTSPTSNLRRLLALMLTPSVIAVLPTTFMNLRRISATRSSFSDPLPASSQNVKSLCRSSLVGKSAASPLVDSFSHSPKKLMKEDSSTADSSPEVAILAKTSSLDTSLAFWNCRIMARALLASFSNSSRLRWSAVMRCRFVNWLLCAVARSAVFSFEYIGLKTSSSQCTTSASASSFASNIAFLELAIFWLASSDVASIESSFAISSLGFWSGAFNASAASWSCVQDNSISSIAFVISSIRPLSLSFSFSSSFSRSSRRFFRSRSIFFSRRMPT